MGRGIASKNSFRNIRSDKEFISGYEWKTYPSQASSWLVSAGGREWWTSSGFHLFCSWFGCFRKLQVHARVNVPAPARCDALQHLDILHNTGVHMGQFLVWFPSRFGNVLQMRLSVLNLTCKPQTFFFLFFFLFLLYRTSIR